MSKERYLEAQKAYAEIGVDTDAALDRLSKVKISIHCWQGDDVTGFENFGGTSGGIAATGNYPGKARTPDELMADIDKALSLIPGKHKLNLHAIYAITGGEKVERSDLKPEHFTKWVEFAKQRGLGLDFNPTLFSHPMVKDGLTLSHPDPEVRKYWIKHCQSCRTIAEYFGKELGQPCVHNIWIPDGLKDIPGDRLGPRMRLKESLDEIFTQKVDKNYVIDTVESKVFGIGVESYTVGSSEFYLNYAAKNNLLCLLDTGHYHPTEMVSDKISSMLVFSDKVALHVSRPVRWDSDHVVILDDELKEISKEIVRNDALDRVLIALDFFDASINRISAWVVGTRNMQKALLYAMLMPHDRMKKLQDESNFTELMMVNEELKTYPFGDVWNYFCEANSAPEKGDWFKAVKEYEAAELSKRK